MAAADEPDWADLGPGLAGPVVGEFALGAEDWEPGHRGVDIGGRVGDTVSAVAVGRVTFTGRIAGRGVVVVSHGRLRSTYEPVAATVSVGDEVAAGDPLGSLEPGHACRAVACLHLGLRAGDTYLDPTRAGRNTGVRLLSGADVKAIRIAAAVAGVAPAGSEAAGTPPMTTAGSRWHPMYGTL